MLYTGFDNRWVRRGLWVAGLGITLLGCRSTDNSSMPRKIATNALGSPDELIPDLTRKCSQASVVMRGEAMKLIRIPTSPNLSYTIITFRVQDVYKGEVTLPMHGIDVGTRWRNGEFINLIVVDHSATSADVYPDYRVGDSYILFLTDVLEAMFVRIPAEAYSLALKSSPAVVAELKTGLHLH